MSKMKKRFPYFFAILLLFVCFSTSIGAYRQPSWSKSGMAATPHVEATNAAVTVLEQGGNAVDAAVAAAFALSVVEQYHSGLGGGEFALIRMVKDDKVVALDARESAPSQAHSEMYIDPATGKKIKYSSSRGGLAVGTPGSVAGRVELVQKFGNLSLSKVVNPSVKLAEEGFIVDRFLATRTKGHQDRLANGNASDVFLEKGQPYLRGELLKQPALAETLTKVSKDGGKSFYAGEQAKAIVKSCKDAGGIITIEDLAGYKIIWREPIEFDYRGHKIYSMPPPSSGGVCLAEILNILEGFPLNYVEQGSAESYHLIASAFELAFADRAYWLGDPDFTPQPTDGMTSPEYAAKLREKINRHYRNPVKDHDDPWAFDDDSNTSHISVIDRDGNMCSITTSVNTSFGSHVFVPELGIFLNSTMDDFVTSPTEPNNYDLIGSEVNRVAPQKRPLSSMSPTLVLKDDLPYIALGSVGGPRIISSVAQMLINIIDYDLDIQAAMDVPRIHMQWRPDKLYVEKEITPEIVKELNQRGWKVYQQSNWSLSQAVMHDAATAEFFGASDARGVGSAEGPSK